MVRAKDTPHDEVATTIESVKLVEDMKFFLLTAPANWLDNQIIRRYCLNNEEGYVSCVRWNGLFFITGTDIVRCIMYKFHHLGRTITDRKKFEEGVFLDLRNLRVGNDAILENPKSEFLDFLHKNQCIRTQKKQKVFFWFNVAHDKLMADALERDIKRERLKQSTVSVALREPALSFNFDSMGELSLEEQLAIHLAKPQFRPIPLKLNNKAPNSSLSSGNSSDSGPFDGVESPLEITRSKRSVEAPDETRSEKKQRRVFDEDDFPLDYLDRENSTSSNELCPPEQLYPPYYGYSPGYYAQAGFSSMFQRSPINIAKNDDYILEQSPLPKFPSMAPLMLVPRLANDNLALPMLPPLSAIPGIWSTYGSGFPLLATDFRLPPDIPSAQLSASQIPNSFDNFCQVNGSDKRKESVTHGPIKEEGSKVGAGGEEAGGRTGSGAGTGDGNKIPTPDSAKRASEV